AGAGAAVLRAGRVCRGGCGVRRRHRHRAPAHGQSGRGSLDMPPMHILRTALLAGILLAAAHAKASEAKDEGFGELTMDQVADLLARNEVSVFDNNGQGEWQSGHVPTAKWVSFKDVKASDLPQDHARKLVFYCANPH